MFKKSKSNKQNLLRYISIVVVLISVCITMQCKKRNSDSLSLIFNKDCYPGPFSVSFSGNVQLADVVQLSDNTYKTLSYSASLITITHLDSRGHLMGYINIPLPNAIAIPVHFLITPDSGYVIQCGYNASKDSVSNISDTNYIALPDLISYCGGYRNYNGVSYMNFIQRKNKSITYLIKYNKDGKQEWSKQFAGNNFIGQSICIKGNNILFLNYRANQGDTFVHGGLSLVDTLKYNYLQKNTLTLYNLKPDGSQSWSKTFNNISGLCYNNFDSKGYTPNFQANLAISGNNIMLHSCFDVIILDNNGNLLSRNNFLNYACNANILNYIGYLNANFDSTLDAISYSILVPNVYTGTRLLNFDYYGNLNYYLALPFNRQGPVLLTQKANVYYIYAGATLFAINNNGRTLYTSTLNNNLTPAILSTSCDGGVLISSGITSTSSTGITTTSTLLTKTDKDGNF